MSWGFSFLAGFAVFLLVGACLYPFIILLRHRAILDVPVKRSSHTHPTPKGAGLLIVPIVIVGWWTIIVLSNGTAEILSSRDLAIGFAGLALCVVSWLDDMHDLSPILRIAVQAVCVCAGVYFIPPNQLLFDGAVPLAVDRALIALGWLWFINLFNFMDGIDGISAVQSIVSGAGIIIIAHAVPLDAETPLLCAVIVGAMAGFLLWNWHPAKIFLGDAGSAPLGYLFGWLFLNLALAGAMAAALIIPGYYLVDSTITLLRRGLAGKKVWQAHREHAYQMAAIRIGHRATSLFVGSACCLTVILGILSTYGLTMLAIIGGTVVSFSLFFYFQRAGGHPSPTIEQ